MKRPMKWPMRTLIGRTAVVAMTALLGACFSGLNSKVPAPQRYLLRVAPAAPALQQASAAPNAAAPPIAARAGLEVLRPTAAPGLWGEGIAVTRPGARLDYYNNARWVADAPVALQALLVEALRSAGRFNTVQTDAGAFGARYALATEIEHFEADYATDGGTDSPPTVRVTLVCTLGRRGDRSVVASFTAHSAVRAQADRMQAVIAAFEQATGEALAQVTHNIVPPAAP